MPIYVYECAKCERAEEKLIGMGNSDLEVICSECDGPMNKVIGGSHFIIKGYSYKNGYSSTNKSERT